MNYLSIVCALIIGYLLGSIPFALVIGKLFYNTDIRQHGSGNLGGTNTGRVLGKKAGITVIVLDVLKVVLASLIVNLLFGNQFFIYAALGAGIGHCFPIFAGFKGGKAVATMFGFLLSLAIFNLNALDFFIPFISFMIVLYLFKMVSLASIVAAITATVYMFFMYPIAYFIATLCFTLLIIYRHKDNIQRIINNEEKKIKWM